MTTIIKFTAQGCGQCKMLEPIFERAIKPFADKACVANFDIDKSPASAEANHVQHVPTIIIRDGYFERERLEDVVTEKKLTETIAKYVGGEAE